MPIDIPALRRMLSAATPGPWSYLGCDSHPEPGSSTCWHLRAGPTKVESPRDNELICALRNSAADLLDELERLRASLTRAEAVVEACVAWQEDSGTCHFCGYEYEGLGAQCLTNCRPVPHDDDCILVERGYIDQNGQRRKGER